VTDSPHPLLAVIGGTGLSRFDGMAPVSEQCVDTPFGAVSAPLQLLAMQGCEFVFLARHGQPHKLPPHRVNYRANLWALRERGVTQIVAVNAVGGITREMASGVIAVPHQLIDYTWGREHTYHDADSLDHVDFSQPYTETLRQRILCAAAASNVDVVNHGIYAATQGPRLETVAEIDRLERDGCNLVGMTGMPEAALARELGIEYASICLVVNPAAGRAPGEITMADIQRVIDAGMGRVRSLLQQVIIT
jgi:5'-methylthioinosine phosphorylase